MKEATDLQIPRSKLFAKEPRKLSRYIIQRVQTNSSGEEVSREDVTDSDGIVLSFPLMSKAVAERMNIARAKKETNVRYVVKDTTP